MAGSVVWPELVFRKHYTRGGKKGKFFRSDLSLLTGGCLVGRDVQRTSGSCSLVPEYREHCAPCGTKAEDHCGVHLCPNELHGIRASLALDLLDLYLRRTSSPIPTFLAPCAFLGNLSVTESKFRSKKDKLTSVLAPLLFLIVNCSLFI